MASTSPGYGITIRVEGKPEFQPVAEITTIEARETPAIPLLVTIRVNKIKTC